jgi:exodeoxyribonuclease V alpha subunit
MTADLPTIVGEEAPDQPRSIDATVARVLYASSDSGWSAVRCRTEHGASFTAVGTLLGVQPSDELRLTGRWVQHPRFGEQFEVQSYVHVAPSTLDGIRRFLASGRVRGIGPTIAERIVEAFGMETLEVIETDPERLLEVHGIGATTLKRIKDSWHKHRGIQQIMVFLTGHGVSPGVAVKAHARYGASALEKVRSNPYRLAEEVFGVGFRTADRIAHQLGIPEDAPERLEAGLLYVLLEATSDGHVFLPRGEAIEAAAELLSVETQDLEPAIDRLAQREQVVVRDRPPSEPAVYPKRLEWAERTVAHQLRDTVATPSAAPSIDVARALEWYQARAGIQLAPRQREALVAALTDQVVVITGGPGTGKTTLIRGVIKILGHKEQRVLLAAPTGRAAKRLQEATGADARTIHRLLEFQPKSRTFGRNANNPLEADVVVIDEASMLDVELAAHLVLAVPPRCRLVLVGDADQLPSVGPGNVLADLISSRAVGTVRLHEIFRQAERSLIVVNAHRINRGEMPYSEAKDEEADFFFVHRDDPVEAADLAIDFSTRRIPSKFRLDPVDDIQVLAPMHRGELGVARLNERLQALLTPAGPELTVGARQFRLGDKVMQLRNNYELDIFNGDIGRITGVDTEERELVVSFDGRPVILESADLDDLVPAYACTIHKAQGSEYPAVVVLLHHSHHIMLQRNLLYTAVTRGRRLVVIVGSRRALGRAVHNATVRQRYTLLADRLREDQDTNETKLVASEGEQR